jgi:hypothetical protein
VLSNKLASNVSVEDNSFTSLLVGFGQFVDHDLDLAPSVSGKNALPSHNCILIWYLLLLIRGLKLKLNISRDGGPCKPFKKYLVGCSLK